MSNLVIKKLAPEYVQLEKIEEKKGHLHVVGNVDEALCLAKVLRAGEMTDYPLELSPGDIVLVHTGAGVRSGGMWFVQATRRDIIGTVLP